MPIHIIPDIKLPDSDELQYNYDSDFYVFIESCLPGIKFINVRRKVRQNKFENAVKIQLQERPRPQENPRESAQEICQTIMAIIQNDIEARDESGSYQVQCVRNTGNAKDNIKAKIIKIDLEEQSAHINDYSNFRDEDEPPPLVSIQAQYIQMLQDQNIKNQSMVTGMMSMMVESFKSQQATISDLMLKSYQIEELHTRERLKEKEENNLMEIAKIKEEKKTERWKHGMALLDQSGAVKKIVDAGTEALKKRLMSEAPELPDPETPIVDQKVQGNKRPKFNSEPVVSSPVRNSSVKNEEDKMPPTTIEKYKKPPENEEKIEDLDDETKKEIDEMLEKEPLRCHIVILAANVTDEQKDALRAMLGEKLFGSLMQLFDSSSEHEAINNLLELRGNITPNDLPNLGKVKKILTEKQQAIIDKILSFDFGE